MSVPDCHLKSWMQERVNVVHRGDGKLLVIDEMKVILQDIRILDIDELFQRFCTEGAFTRPRYRSAIQTGIKGFPASFPAICKKKAPLSD